MDYLEEEDLTTMTVKVEPKKTTVQSIRQTKEAKELEMNIEAEKLLEKEEEDKLLKLSGQEKEKTIKCLLKVLSYQV
jgi:hypothetical protein